MDICATVKVKPWGKDQGAFVEINEEDFDAKVHKKLSDAELAKLSERDPLDHDGDGRKGGSLPAADEG